MTRPSRQQVVIGLPRIAGALVLTLSTIVLLGWAMDIRVMQSLYPGLVTMKANTAAGLATAAIALLCLQPCDADVPRRPRIVAVLALLVGTIGVGTLAQYAFHVNLGIDQLLFRAGADAALTPTPGRMAAVTAFAFVLMGAALAPVRRNGGWPAHAVQASAIAVAVLGLTSVLGYVYGAIPGAGLGQGIQIAPHTAVALVLLAVGLLACRAETGWMATVLSDGTGGTLARRLLPVAFAVPLALGALRQALTGMGVLGDESSSASMAAGMMLVFGVIIWRTAAALDQLDRERRAAEQARFELTLQEQAARDRADAEHARRGIAEHARDVAVQASREKDAAYAVLDATLAIAERQREEAEQAVREREEALMVLDRVMESTTIGIAVFDTELRYLRINSALAAIDGLPAEAHVGRTVLQAMPEHGEELTATLRSVLETGVPVLNVERALDAGSERGHKREWMLSFYPLRAVGGELFGAAMTALETTEQHSMERQLRQSQKMEAVGQLAGGVAHDFNNILTVITSYSSMLLTDLAPDAPIRGDVQQISDAADRASGLTRQLLAFSRQQVLEPQVIDLNALTTDLEKMLRRVLRADISFMTRLQPELGMVHADPGQLEQVLMNLVVNARDAMPNGGELTVETSNVDLDEAYAVRHVGVTPGAYVMLTVSDTGSGMDARTQAQIFDPFFTTKEKGQGTGLGLSTVYGIVKQSGGFIWVYSEPGHGTVFRVYLARTQHSAARRTGSEVPTPVTRGSETILLAEDEAPVRTVARRLLQRAGYTVLEASTGTEALEVARRPGVAIHLLLTDLVMPELNGRELAERFRELHPQAGTAFMSGYTEEAIQRRSVFRAGVVFIQKPFTPQRLLTKVREALDGAVREGAEART
ncbi:MAG TPA: ATP-binding protein [Gemmatimonadaceae bacterium]|nr:ATP-binding protein [Gemmatimonadaceae bacterium]